MRATNRVCPEPILPSEEIEEEILACFPEGSRGAFWYYSVIEQQEALDIAKGE